MLIYLFLNAKSLKTYIEFKACIEQREINVLYKLKVQTSTTLVTATLQARTVHKAKGLSLNTCTELLAIN